MKERLSYAYVHAVVARAGATCQPYQQDYGSDARISAIRARLNGGYAKSANGFECQLKATTAWQIREQTVVYDLDAKAYNKLVELEDMFGILILVCLPADETDWLRVAESALSLRKCCYWIHLTGETVSNASAKRIWIPRQQLFDTDAVTQLLARVDRRNAEFRRWERSR